MWPENGTIFVRLKLTVPNINRFSKLLHYQNQENLITLSLKTPSAFACKTLAISQGSVSTHLRCGRVFSDNIITNFLLILRGIIIVKTG